MRVLSIEGWLGQKEWYQGLEGHPENGRQLYDEHVYTHDMYARLFSLII